MPSAQQRYSSYSSVAWPKLPAPEFAHHSGPASPAFPARGTLQVHRSASGLQFFEHTTRETYFEGFRHTRYRRRTGSPRFPFGAAPQSEARNSPSHRGWGSDDAPHSWL